MNNAELIEHIATTAGIEKATAKKAMQAMTSAITSAAKGGNAVALAGFGQFKVKDVPARQRHNPSTGATMEIAAARKLTFVAAKAVKEMLNA